MTLFVNIGFGLETNACMIFSGHKFSNLPINIAKVLAICTMSFRLNMLTGTTIDCPFVPVKGYE